MKPLTGALIVAAALAATIAPAAAQSPIWTTHGPYGVSPVVALAIDPTTPSTLYAATGNGVAPDSAIGDGVFRSTDSGGSWSAVNTGLDLNVDALAIDPATPSTPYAGSYDSGVFQSTNSGGSWTAVNTGLSDLSVAALVINPTTPSTLYAGTYGSGVFRSTDSGGSWSAVNTGLPKCDLYTNTIYVTALAIDPTTPSTLYAEIEEEGVFRSTNSGGSWSSTNTPSALLAFDPTTPSTLYAGTEDGVSQSTDSGASWTAVNAGLSNLGGVSALAIDPTTPSTLYAGTGGGGVFQSTNSGGSWTAVNTGLSNPYVNALAIDPTPPSTLHAGTANSPLRKPLQAGRSLVAV
ncbi:MAG TPA: hypothetical protein VN812_04565 [Candidatus Acidoferrales bacterium]|nr:hypothetical protein [Candidatus Acidoferrales bacterium]